MADNEQQQREDKATTETAATTASETCTPGPAPSSSATTTTTTAGDQPILGEKIDLPEFDYDSEASEEEEVPDYVPVSQRPEWSDVTPVPQDDGPHQVVAIKYSDKFRETFDYFRAVLASNEISERAFNLTTECLRLNPSNYTVWYYRRKLIEGLNYDYNEENSYIRRTILKNPKNYQVWEHYKTVLVKLRSGVDEKKRPETVQAITRDAKSFIRQCLSEDVKNYHAWQLLQWMINDWSQWDGELEYCDKLLDDDIRNNSAWNHRFFVLMHTTKFEESVIDNEMSYTIKMIEKAPKNESAWNFLSGLLDRAQNLTSTSHKNLEDFCQRISETPGGKCNYLVAFMIKYYSKQLVELVSSNKDSSECERLYTLILDLYASLTNELDTFRQTFWQFEQKVFVGTFAKIAEGISTN